jgi:hypothetical protein
MRNRSLGAVLFGIVFGCTAADPGLTPSNGIKVGMAQFKAIDHSSGPLRRLSLEVIVDSADATLKNELFTTLCSSLDGSKSLKSVRADSGFVLRVIVSKENVSGFENQNPIRLKLLVVDRDNDDPPHLSRLESAALMEGNFACLRRQAQELCKMFVTDLDIVFGMVREMKKS